MDMDVSVIVTFFSKPLVFPCFAYGSMIWAMRADWSDWMTDDRACLRVLGAMDFV
jgi:hypothetical protein